MSVAKKSSPWQKSQPLRKIWLRQLGWFSIPNWMESHSKFLVDGTNILHYITIHQVFPYIYHLPSTIPIYGWFQTTNQAIKPIFRLPHVATRYHPPTSPASPSGSAAPEWICSTTIGSCPGNHGKKKQGTYGKITLELSFNDNEPLRKYGAYHGIQGSDNVTPKSCLACFWMAFTIVNAVSKKSCLSHA